MTRREPPSPGRFSLIRNTVRAAVTTPLFMVGHLARRHQVRTRHATVGAWPEQPPSRPSVAGSVAGTEGVQSRSDGAGPQVFRRYDVEIRDAEMTAEELMGQLIADPNLVAPTSLAAFYRDDERVRDLQVGDDVVVELPGPWNGPVRVEHVGRTELLFSTLDGHMEAGLIRFDITAADDGPESTTYRFRITSWARAGDRIFEFLHLTIPVGREVQTAMWIGMCRKAAQIAGAQPRHLTAITNVVQESESDDR